MDQAFGMTNATKGAGHTGWTVALLKGLRTAGHIGRHATTLLLTHMLWGDMSAEVLDGLHQVLVTPLPKPNGDIRPIAVREAPVLLLGKTVWMQDQASLLAHLGPQRHLQLGVGVPGGAEIGIHSIRDALSCRPDFVTLCLDMQNGYGSVKRAKVKELADAIATAAPATKRYMDRFVLPAQRFRIRGDDAFYVTEGIVQGDPLSPWIFCALIQPTLVLAQELLREHGGQVVAFIDDIMLTGPANAVHEAAELIKSGLATVGLHFNNDKTRVLLGALVNPLQVTNLGYTTVCHCTDILGAPVGRPDIEAKAAKDMVPTQLATALTTVLKDKQTQLLLLRYGLATKGTFVARTVPPAQAHETLKAVDDLVQGVLQHILGLPNRLPPNAVAETSLPIDDGGLGLTQLTVISRLAYLASVWSASTRMWRPGDTTPNNQGAVVAGSKASKRLHDDVSECLVAAHKVLQDHAGLFHQPSTQLTAAQVTAGTATPPPHLRGIAPLGFTLPASATLLFKAQPPDKLQRRLCSAMHDLRSADLYSKLTSLEHKAQYLSKRGPCAGAALLAVPSSGRLSISNPHMTVFLRQRLRIGLLPAFGLQADVPCACAPNNTAAAPRVTETHIIHCRLDGSWIRLHEGIADVFADMAVETHNSTYHREAYTGAGDASRYDGTVELDGRTWAFDFTAKSTQAKNHVAKAATTPLHVAECGASEKRRKYMEDRPLPPNVTFQPLVFEVGGGMHPDVPAFMAKMLRPTAGRPPVDATFAAPTALSYWTQVLAVKIAILTAENTLRVLRALSAQSEGRGHRRLGANATALPAALL
jgi:hypothetical protein